MSCRRTARRHKSCFSMCVCVCLNKTCACFLNVFFFHMGYVCRNKFSTPNSLNLFVCVFDYYYYSRATRKIYMKIQKQKHTRAARLHYKAKFIDSNVMVTNMTTRGSERFGYIITLSHFMFSAYSLNVYTSMYICI